MAFIGTPLDTRNTFQSLVGKRFNGDGSTTAFTLDVAPSSTLDLEVFVGNVRQDPNSAYTLSGTTLTFTGAPPSGTNNIYVVHQAKSVGTIDLPEGALVDLNGGSDKLVLDADGDTTISADTDDQIDIKIAGADDFQFQANKFLVQTGSKIDINGTELILDADADTSITADTDDQIDIKIANADDFTFTANSFNVLSGSEIDLADNCELRVGDGDDLKIFHNGSNSIIASQTGDLQIRAGDTGQNFYIYDHDASNSWLKITGTNGYIQAIGVYNQSAGDSANVVIDGSGNLYRSTSALKYKQDVRDLESIDISGFRPVRYKSKSPKDDPEKDFIGFIADEFHDAGLTELVSYGNDSDGKPTVVEGFNYDRLTVILTKALQEANAKIATLEAKVKALEEA